MTNKPNFLFIMTDQHRSDWLGCTGHPVVKTPNIDALAATGTVFDDFHVASPICMPNRASFMTGRMPSLHGLRYNGCTLPLRANTFVDVLAAGGYRTASIGKSHLQPFLDGGPARAPDPTERLVPEAWKPEEGLFEEEQPDRFAGPEYYDVPVPYYGYQHIDLATDHGDRCGGHYQQWFRKTCSDWQALSDPANELAHNYTCPQAYRTPIPEEFYPTTWIADRAIDYLEGRAGEPEPFFAFVSFPDPHHPFNPPGKYWDMYSPDDFDVDLPYEAHQNPPPPMQFINDRFAQGLGPEIPQGVFRTDPQHIREAMALTAGMITMIDDQVGRIVAALKESGQFDNTIIIFNSDHGDYLGDFEFLLKGALPFRSITQVPMIWSDPMQNTVARSDALASTLDLSASILDRAGLAPYHGIQGESFLPSLAADVPHRDALFMEYNDGAPRLGFEKAARMRSLRTKHWRFTTYLGQDWGELYDLTKDPRETRNLWDDPAHASTKAELSLRMIDHLTAQMDESPRARRRA
ncbi:MAG: sulfatase-like hydrolase/transferase [Maritimibacter sp.]|nr:sulfatase-like hydrolase/transferase [Maritimibacter sp.]